MPCTYYTPAEEREIAAREHAKTRAEHAKTRGELNDTTRLLCRACRMLTGADIPLPPELKVWWSKHKKLDDKRRADERAKRELAKGYKTARAKVRSAKRRR